MDWAGLGRDIAGELILAGDERMALARKQHACSLPLAEPEVLLRCAGVEDVRRAVDFVARDRPPFAVRSGGHCFGDRSSSAGLVIDLSAMNQIVVEEGAVRSGPGALSGDLSRAIGEAGRILPTGGCPLVAVGGLALAGGFGFLGRRLGLVADRVRSLEIVLADGRLAQASADENSDLFWALRGGGALGFGIVTGLALETAPLEPLVVLNGRWPLAEAVSLVEAWQAWAPDAADKVGLQLGLVSTDFPDEPAFVELYGIVAGPPAEAAVQVAQVRARLGRLASGLETWAASPAEAADYCVGLADRRMGPAWLPERPYAEVGLQATRSQFFDGSIGRARIEECVRHFAKERLYAQHREIELVPWRGAYAKDDRTACFLHRTPRLLVRHTATVGARSTSQLRAATAAWARRSAEVLAPDWNGRSYQGYAEPGWDDEAVAFHGDRLSRLIDVRERYDPDDLFSKGTSRFTVG